MNSMKGLAVGPYTFDEVLAEGPNMIYARGTGPDEVLLAFWADKVDTRDTRGPIRRDDNPLAQAVVTYHAVETKLETAVPNVLPLLGTGHTTGWTVLVYPFVRALPLCIHMKTVPTIRRREALQWTMGVVDIIAGLHDAGLRSTEVHIGNVLIDGYDQIYLAYNRTLVGDDYRRIYKEHPQAKRFDVISPEEVWGNGSGPSTDIFQLGALLTTMVTRRLLVLAPDVAKMDYQAALQGLYPPSDFMTGLPKGFEAITGGALTADPLDRFETITEFRQALDDLLEKARITDAVSDVVRQGFVRKGTEPTLAKRKKAPPPAPDAPPDFGLPALERLGPHGVPVIGGLGLLVLIAVFGLSGGGSEDDVPVVPTRKVTVPTASATAPTSRPTPTPRSTATSADEVIDATELMPELNQARARPTDVNNYRERKKFLQKCYLRLPRSHRGQAISSSIFQQLFELGKRDRDKAYKLLDETFEKFETYLREHNARM